MNNSTIAWLVPVAWFYWQPTLSEFTKIFPQTTVFTALFPGYARGYEDSLNLQIIGRFKLFRNQKKIAKSQYGSGFTYLSPEIVIQLLKLKPNLVFTNSFGLWTILALLFKPVGKWQVVIAYEGSAPGVDFLDSPFRLWVRKVMVIAADFYISNSQRGKAYLIDSLEANPEKVFAQPYEIPSSESLSSNSDQADLSHLPKQKPIFLFVGRLLPRKGVQLLLEACLNLKQKGLEQYSLLIVGDGEQRQELEKFCQDNRLTTSVRWLGRIDYQEISSYFQAADVFILPTLEDTWGVVTLEVMLFGKPVLCSTGAGSSEMIVNSENGYVFDPQKPEQLAELMTKLIEQPELIPLMGNKSRQIIANYTPASAARSLADLTIFALQQ